MRGDDRALALEWRIRGPRCPVEEHRRPRLDIVCRPRERGCRRIVTARERNPRTHHRLAQRVGIVVTVSAGELGELWRVVPSEHEGDLEYMARAEPTVERG